MRKQFIIAAAMLSAGLAAQAADINISDNIVQSQTWTSNNVYHLMNQVYVRDGASLTIEPGTLISSGSSVTNGGSLAVMRGAKIYVNGTQDHPVIMTSWDDPMTSWQEGCNKWGNLTIMGNGLISDSAEVGNSAYATGLNESQMEGLTDLDAKYGGNDDNDCSGSISYLSIRYGGKVVGLANELNGLSLGGIGRETDIHHVEIMNNVDDGIEIWGGTVNLKYVNIWNIGDDSLDCDQGWRGKAQFGLIVQGYSQTGFAQGSGWGDNCIEIDGAEDSDAQPVTTTKIANFTVIGEPVGGDGATVWRDNARVQYKNCIFMNIGEEVVRFDDADGDGASGYGFGGTLDWTNTWNTSYSYYAPVNWTNAVYLSPADMYPVQTSGNLAQLEGCLVYACANDSGDAAFGTNSFTYKVKLGGVEVTKTGYAINAFLGEYNNKLSNPSLDNVVAATSPIQGITRGAPVTVGQTGGTKNILPVTFINPCAANDALTVDSPVEADEFFVAAPYRGAFSATHNWLAGWTAADAYGMVETSMNVNTTAAIATASVVVSFESDLGVEYDIESAVSMDGPWDVVTTVTGTGSTISYGDASLSDAEFYRVVSK